MASSRRDFLKKGSLVALFAGIPLGFAEKIIAKETYTPSNTLGLSQAEFRRELNTSFDIRFGNKKASVKLVDVKDLRRKGTRNSVKECFGLRFRGDHANSLNQNTYVIEHKNLGQFSLLLVPIGVNDKSAPYYEAIINRLHS
jgi:hypothetical protein